MKLSATLCAVILAGMTFAAMFSERDALVMNASAAEPSYEMTDTYKNSKFYANFKSVKLTGDQRKDVIAVAISQLGYHEGNSEADLDGSSTDGVRDFVEYNVLAGKFDNDQGNGLSYGYYWCASFVNWCMRQAGVPESASAGAEISCQRWISNCSEVEIYRARGSYVPKTGDMIFFRDRDSSVSATHIGLVLYVGGGKVHTIEGNTSFTNDYSSDGEYVAVKSYPLNSDYIVGYAALEYNEEKSYERVDHSGAFKTQGQYMPHGRVNIYSDKELTASIGEMDSFTLFDVTEVSADHLEVSAYVNETKVTGYIAADSDVIQATSSQKVYKTEYLDDKGNTLFNPQYRLEDQKKNTYANAPQREDCGFVGWKYNSSDGEAVIPAGEELPAINTDATLVAVFDCNFYLVSFQRPDKTLISQSFGYYGAPLKAPSVEVDEGYVFIGWDAEVGDMIVGNATYTARIVTEAEYESMTADSGTTPALPKSGCRSSLSPLPCFMIALAIAGLTFKGKKN